METLRLRKIQLPSRLDQLLDSFVCHSDLVPEGAFRTRDVRALPRELRTLTSRATQRGQTWGCWEKGLDTWVILCEMSLAHSRERGAPVLQIELYGEEGLKDSGLWTSDRHGTWSRCSY